MTTSVHIARFAPTFQSRVIPATFEKPAIKMSSTPRETMTMASVTVITVTLSDREDGGLRIYSEDLPNLILSGPDRIVIAAAIVPAIEAIFKRKGFENVIVRPARPVAEVLQNASPRDVAVHVQHEQQFVVEPPETPCAHGHPVRSRSPLMSTPAIIFLSRFRSFRRHPPSQLPA